MDIQVFLNKAMKGDEEAFISLYNHFFPILFGYCFNQLGHYQDTEDVVTEIFMAVEKGIMEFQENASFKTWIFAIAKNKLADFWRKNHSNLSYDDGFNSEEIPLFYDDEVAKENNSEQKLSLEGRTKLEQILNQLPLKYSTVMRLRFLDRCSLKEVAEKMQESIANVKVLQFRATKKCVLLARENTYEQKK